MVKRFAPFLDLAERTQKPRKSGLTMVFDHGWPVSFVEETAEALADAIDIVKISYFHLYQSEGFVTRKLKAYKKYDVDIQAGGPIIEIARAEHKEVQTLKYLKRLGFDSLEVASEAVPTKPSEEEDEKFIALCKSMGFGVHGEVGKKFPEGDQTRRSANEVDVAETVKEFKSYLRMGAENVYWEGHLLRMALGEMGQREEGRKPVLEVAKAVGQNNIIFEVPGTFLPYAGKRALQALLVYLFGPNVNIGNALPEELTELEVIRAGNFPAFGAPHGDHPWMASLVNHGGKAASEWWKGK